jgi:integrase
VDVDRPAVSRRPGVQVAQPQRPPAIRRSLLADWRRVRLLRLVTRTPFHRLRHGCASLLIAQDVSPKKLQARLGHASITETMDTYGHIYPDDDTSVREVIEPAFDDATSTLHASSQRLTRKEAKL